MGKLVGRLWTGQKSLYSELEQQEWAADTWRKKGWQCEGRAPLVSSNREKVKHLTLIYRVFLCSNQGVSVMLQYMFIKQRQLLSDGRIPVVMIFLFSYCLELKEQEINLIYSSNLSFGHFSAMCGCWSRFCFITAAFTNYSKTGLYGLFTTVLFCSLLFHSVPWGYVIWLKKSLISLCKTI